jgi:hypothetical protein
VEFGLPGKSNVREGIIELEMAEKCMPSTMLSFEIICFLVRLKYVVILRICSSTCKIGAVSVKIVELFVCSSVSSFLFVLILPPPCHSMDTDPGRIEFLRAIYVLKYDFRAKIVRRKALNYQAKAAHFTTAISPFLGHKNDLSTPHTLHKTKQSLLIQSPGNEKSSFIIFLEMISGIFVSLLLPGLPDQELGAGDVKESAPGVICHI